MQEERRKQDNIQWARDAAIRGSGQIEANHMAGAVLTLCDVIDRRKPTAKETPNGAA